MKFPNYLEQQFLAWQQRNGRRKTLDEFAHYLEISRPLLSMWLKGTRRPGPKKIEFLVELFGPEVYDSLGIPRPDPDLQTLENIWYRIPKGIRQVLREQGEKFVDKNDPPSHNL
jgi:transcriptional regulator with XRE-family HTH domain